MQSHFKYDGNVKVSLEKIASMKIGNSFGQFPAGVEVNDIQFMTPARVSYCVEDGEEQEAIIFVDLIRKKAYNDSGELDSEFVSKLFECLSVSTHIRDDMFEADQKTYEKIDQVQHRHDEIYGSHLKEEE